MHTKRIDIEIMINDKADGVLKVWNLEFLKLFDSLKNRHQNNLETMIGSKFVSAHV